MPVQDDADGARPLDELFAAYGAGALDPARHALVASHLLLKPENRRFVRALEAASGSALAAQEAPPLARRDARLAAIFAAQPAPLHAPVAAPADAASDTLPAPLRRFIGADLGALAWRFVIPGVRECKLGAVGGGDASLIHVRAGRRLPQHTHEGSELTLVLTGAFRDQQGRYARGDIALADSAIDHSPQVDDDGDCLCFAVTDAPLRLTSPIGRLVERFLIRRH
ncbi:MAG TPA: ChrR family anti-sigma-E factor [Beijerinckiaceae bacterium]